MIANIDKRVQEICQFALLNDKSELLTGERSRSANEYFDYVLICHTETGWPINKRVLFNSRRRKAQQFCGAAALLIPLSNFRHRPEYYVCELPAQIKEQTSADVFNVNLAMHFWQEAIKSGRIKRARVLVLLDVHTDDNGEALANLLTTDIHSRLQATSSTSSTSANQNQLKKLQLLYQQQLTLSNALVTVRNVTRKQSRAVRKLSKNKADEGKALLDRIWTSPVALRRYMRANMMESLVTQL